MRLYFDSAVSSKYQATTANELKAFYFQYGCFFWLSTFVNIYYCFLINLCIRAKIVPSQKSTQKFLKKLWFNFFYFKRKFTRSNKLQHDEIYSAVMCSIYSLLIMSCKVSWRMFSILFCLTRNVTCLSFC